MVVNLGQLERILVNCNGCCSKNSPPQPHSSRPAHPPCLAGRVKVRVLSNAHAPPMWGGTTPPQCGDDAVAAMRILRLFSPVCSSSHPLHLHGPSQYRTTHHLSLFEAFQQILQTHVRARTWFQCVYNHRQLQGAGEKFLSNLINRR